MQSVARKVKIKDNTDFVGLGLFYTGVKLRFSPKGKTASSIGNQKAGPLIWDQDKGSNRMSENNRVMGPIIFTLTNIITITKSRNRSGWNT